jgi:hypothetical protein
MYILSFLANHKHYWGIPHERKSDKRLVQTCYECGAERLIKVDLRPLWIPQDPDSEDREIKVA